MIESWINLPKKKTAHWDEGEHLHYIATLMDTLGVTTLTAYQTGERIEAFPEIAKRLNNGTFFDKQLTSSQQRKLVIMHYARYREYPRP